MTIFAAHLSLRPSKPSHRSIRQSTPKRPLMVLPFPIQLLYVKGIFHPSYAVSIFQSLIVLFPESKFIPTFTIGRPERAKRAA